MVLINKRNLEQAKGFGNTFGFHGGEARVGHSQKFIKPCEKECRVFFIHL